MKKLKYLFLAFCLSLTFSSISIDANAQCPMCKMSAEQNLKDGGTAGKGLNNGIFIMLAMPYVLIGTLGVLWYRNRKDEEIEDLLS